MKKLIEILALVSILFWSSAVAKADNPYIKITTTPKELDLGLMPYTGEHESSTKLIVRVESNYLHGPILVSLTKLRRLHGDTILPENISIKTPLSGGFVPMNKPITISKPTAGSHEIELHFKVKTSIKDLAGKYQGELIFTIMPPA
jgi:hypothetical protein